MKLTISESFSLSFMPSRSKEARLWAVLLRALEALAWFFPYPARSRFPALLRLEANSHANESRARSATSWAVWVPDIFLPFVKGSEGFRTIRRIIFTLFLFCIAHFESYFFMPLTCGYGWFSAFFGVAFFLFVLVALSVCCFRFVANFQFCIFCNALARVANYAPTHTRPHLHTRKTFLAATRTILTRVGGWAHTHSTFLAVMPTHPITHMPTNRNKA